MTGSAAFPVQCACGGANTVYFDIMRNIYVVRCECGTVLEVDGEEAERYYEAERMTEHTAYCCESERILQCM